MEKLKQTSSRHSLRQEDSEKPASSNFLSSVLSAAQNVTSVLRGSTDHKRTASDGAFLTFINEAAQPFDNPLAHLNNNGTRLDYEEGEEPSITKVSDIKIEPIRSAISTLGKGELSLESLGLTPDENPSVPMQPAQGHYPVALNQEESLRAPESGFVSIKEPHESRRQSLDPISPKKLQRTRNSLIARPSEKTKLDMPVRSQSVNSSSKGRRSRGSFSEDPTGGVNPGAVSSSATFATAAAGGAGVAGAGPYSATSAAGGGGASVPAASSSALPELEEKHHATVVSTPHHAAYDSDDSDRLKARADLDTGKHLAGFAYANKKRNQDFHKLFRSLPPNDFLLDDFSCALSREILIQGRMYVSERNICFNSNILGWVTNLIISFDEIVGLEKKTTAGLFPNGIVVQTLHARSSFASFISRDTVFEFLMSIWRQTNARPDLMNGTIVESGSNDFSRGFEASDDEESDLSGADSDVTRSDELSHSDFEEFDSNDDNFSGSDSDLFTDDEFGESARQAKPKDKEKADGAAAPASAAATPTASTGSADPVPAAGTAAGSQWPTQNLGAETHASSNPHYDYEAAGEKLLVSDTIMAPLGVVANLLFGDNVKWVSTFITDKEKNTDLKNMAAFEGGLSGGHKRVYEYIKPLGGPVGPKQTRCLCTDTVEEWDMDSQCIVVTSTQTPDVPSGSVFTTKTRYTLFWGDNNTTTVLLTYLIDWTGKSWFKGPIEKGTHDGQMAFAKNLIKELNETIKKAGRAAAAKGAPASKTASGGAGKRPRGASGTQKKRKRADSAKKKQEPVTAVRRIVDLLVSEPFSMLPVPMWAFVLLGLVLVWTFQAVTGGARVGRGGVGSVASGAHDYYTRVSSARMSREQLEMIRLEEEYNVWRWIDDRSRGADPNQNCKRFNRALYHEQNLQEAIKLTELRVQELKRALDL